MKEQQTGCSAAEHLTAREKRALAFFVAFTNLEKRSIHFKVQQDNPGFWYRVTPLKLYIPPGSNTEKHNDEIRLSKGEEEWLDFQIQGVFEAREDEQ